MDITSFLKDNDLSLSLFIVSITFFLLLIIKQTFYSKSDKNLPPGPSKLPIIGNLHQAGDNPHILLAELAKTYGPLMSLRLGRQLVVVASSPEAAMGILRTQDQHLSARFVPTAYQLPEPILTHSLMWSDCNQTWKSLRTLCRSELFSTKALEAQSILREEKLSKLLDFLCRKQGQVINVDDVVFTTQFNTITSIIFAKEFIDLAEENGTNGWLKESIHKLIEYGGRVKDIGSFFPILERFDLQSINKSAMNEFTKIFAVMDDIIKERRARVNSSTWSSEQAQSFLDRLLEIGFSNNQIYQLYMELWIAGTNTTTRTVLWVISELVRHPEVISKIRKEIKNEINTNRITTSQLSRLTYLQACIKETFRLHPSVPLLLPHKASETCEVMNYTIPKNTKLFVNVWAIGRDPKLWDKPLSFNPERFIGSKLDFKGQDFELLPFGSGRRICPGMPSGIRSVELIVANLVNEFDWALPNGDDPSKLDMNERFGIAMKREKPLKLIFKQKEVNQHV